MTNVWFTSDHHFGHEKVAEIRGYSSTKAMNLEIIERHNDLVRRDDVVWMLGDLSSGSTSAVWGALLQVNALNGRKRLIAGNHDPVHPMNRDAWKWYSDFHDYFESVMPFARVSLEGTRVLLSHFPYHVDRKEPRYTQYRLRDEGMPLIHGHLHVPEKITSPREVHIGLDAWDLFPAPASEVSAIFRKTGVIG